MDSETKILNERPDFETLSKKVDDELSHVWMVRTFLKHSEEAEEDDELNEVHRDLYDFALALGPPFEARDWEKYVKTARRKLKRLINATNLFNEIQPEISSHTNFKMAAQSLRLSTATIQQLLSDLP